MRMTKTLPHSTLDNVCLPEALAKENPDLFSDGQIKWLLKTRHQNGLAEADAVLKISGRLYLIKSKFLDWFFQQKAS